MSRLFKSNCPTCTVVSNNPTPPPTANPVPSKPPAPALVQAAKTDPAKPGDWRESWGPIEPWKAPAQANSGKPVELTQRVNPEPVRMEPPKQPDPLNAPEHYRDLAMNARLSNSKIPIEDKHPVVNPTKTPSESMPPGHPTEGQMVVNAALPNGAMPASPPPGRPTSGVIQLAADEANAFWSPPQPSAEAKQEPKNNAFDRDPNPPPQGIPPARPDMAPMPPRGPVTMFPRPPLPPGPPPSPSRPDMGVPDAMGNAFTLAGTRRPIPADFGGTPQEPNGFDPPMQGGGSPPIAYSMGGAPMPQRAMPNMMAMGRQGGPMPPNPLMSVPPASPIGPGFPVASKPAQPGGAPQLLATLKDSLYPSERETAAEQLSELNWRVQPLVVESLLKAAREDPAATVRAACVHALAHMNVTTPAATAVVRELKSDPDPRVRQEAEEALATLGDRGIQQASHK